VEAKDELAAIWKRAGRVAVLTGAGISTASEIPDFRSPGGRWERYQPVTLQDFLAKASAREEYWRYKGETWQLIRSARPNPGHAALTELAGRDHIALLVTQNVDGLHERSGFPEDRIVNIHGSDRAVVCMSCGAREERAQAQRQWESGVAVPSCGCGGPFKPATISFGQGLVADDLERSFAAARDCDLFVGIGTSLVVSPINQMAELALRAGAATAILTASETPFDGVCDIKLDDPLEELLPELRDRILRGEAPGAD
jgi:NAD-dependent deacetylase